MSDLTTRIARLNDVLCTVNTLQWDARVMMPKGGAETRGHQIATLKGIAREMILDPAMGEAAEAALNGPDAEQARAVLEARDWHSRLSADLLRRQAEKSAVAAAAWAEARAKGDFAIFKPHLAETIDLAREMSAAAGIGDHPYDAMVHVFEPGETADSLTATFDALRQGIKPILDARLGAAKPRSDFLFRPYPVKDQQAFAQAIAGKLGYDYDRGRLDTAVHPFEISFTRNDVRITSRWQPNYLPMSIFGTIHETGHALYEMGNDPAHTRSAFATDMIGLYAVGGTSFGMHESQSRLLENHVGRSAAFWAQHYGLLRDHFPEQLSDVTEAEWVAAINRTEPGLIRVEADELTYDLHIMLRVRLEMALMDGTLAVDDIPDAWNAAMREDLGQRVPNDGLGCLQDVHWSSGYIGSFPTYTIGNMTAASLMAHLRTAQPAVTDACDGGDYAPLRAALSDIVWQHGRSKTRAQIMDSIGTTPSDPAPYLAYLSAKFAD